MQTISAEALHKILSGAARPLLIHVLPSESWEVERLPGSVCACAYEVGFVDAVSKLAPSKQTAIIVYGEGEPSLDSQVAREKLLAAGFTAVTDFRGGLLAWKRAGFSVEGTGHPEEPPAVNGRWIVDTEKSVIRWTGRNLFNFHEGTVKLSGGELYFHYGEPGSGHFTIDMNSIACSDIKDPELNAALIRHLKDDDFFGVSRWPMAEFDLTGTHRVYHSTPGTPNWEITGDFTLRGVTRTILFPAVVGLSPEGNVTAQAQIEIDRTDWGVNYGSGRLFAKLGKHVVNDHIHLHLTIHAFPHESARAAG